MKNERSLIRHLSRLLGMDLVFKIQMEKITIMLTFLLKCYISWQIDSFESYVFTSYFTRKYTSYDGKIPLWSPQQDINSHDISLKRKGWS